VSTISPKAPLTPYTDLISKQPMTLNLTAEQFAILQTLVNEGMETVLSPYDDIETTPAQDAEISKILDAVTFFNSHAITYAA